MAVEFEPVLEGVAACAEGDGWLAGGEILFEVIELVCGEGGAAEIEDQQVG